MRLVFQVGTNAQFRYPRLVTLSPDGGLLYVSSWYQVGVRVVNLGTLQTHDLIGRGTSPFCSGEVEHAVGTSACLNGLMGLSEVSPDGNYLYGVDGNEIWRFALFGTNAASKLPITHANGQAFTAFSSAGLCIAPDGSALYAANEGASRPLTVGWIG